MSRLMIRVLLVVLVAATATHVRADELLTFSGLKDLEPISNFYNGGTGGFGSSGGQNFGITFSSDALAIKSYLQGGAGGFALPPTQTPALFFTGAMGVMTVAN